MKYAITNEEKTLFLSMQNSKICWTPNINHAYIFKTVPEAVRYSDQRQVSNFLNFESDCLDYVNDISGLLEIENKRVKDKLQKEYVI